MTSRAISIRAAKAEPFPREVLDTCRAILARGSKSFALASWALPPATKDAAAVLYAFCREADDAVDRPGAGPGDLARMEDRLHWAALGRHSSSAVDRGLAILFERFALPRRPLELLLEGMGWDLAGRRYATLPELRAYAYRVAGTVGELMAALMGARTPSLLAGAVELGVAMQLTNIARDVGEDARNGRLYLPLSWMSEQGMDPDAFVAAPSASPALRVVIERLLAAADDSYRSADPAIGALPRRARVAIRAARSVYADIGRVIARNGYDVVSRRAVVSTPRKLWLLAAAIGSLSRGVSA